jgi:hypothetical protein
MRERLARYHENMSTMLFGPIPAFDDVMIPVVELEAELNRPNSRKAELSGPAGQPAVATQATPVNNQ